MKKIFFILCFQLALVAIGFAQVIPKGMFYQAVARNTKGEIIPNQKLSLKFNLISNEDQIRVNYYSEVHEVITNELGLFNAVIGEGSKESGEYGLVPWNTENIWMEVEIKDKDHSEFRSVSSSKLQAVPYAIHASTANALSDKNESKTSSFSPPEPGVMSNTWSVLGNAKTDLSGNPFRVNSLGTTDLVDLYIITDNVERMRILAGGDIVTKLNFEVGQNLHVGQNLYIVSTATIGDSMIVKQSASLNTTGGSTINYGPFTVEAMSPTHLTGRLTVDRSSDLNSTLTVDGPTDINARLFVNNQKPTLLTGSLQVDSITNLNDAVNVNNMSPTSLSGTLRVDSCATFNDKVKIVSTFETDTSAGVASSGSLQVLGGAYIKKNFYIGGAAKFAGPVAFGGVVSIYDMTQSVSTTTGALKVTGGVGIGKNINVGGAATVAGMLTIKDVTQSTDYATGALKVFGGVGIRKRLNVKDTVLFCNTLDVALTTTLNNILIVQSSAPFIANFRNLNGAKNGISIQINNGNAAPGWANNFLEFRNNTGGVVGRVEGENASEYMNNEKFKYDKKFLEVNILISEFQVVSNAIRLASAIAGVIAAATSTTVCAGLGVCVQVPIISLIIQAALDVIARSIALASAVVGLDASKARKNDFLNYKASHVGVTYESGSGDYAEWLPKSNSDESFLPGHIVALTNGQISKTLDGVGRICVISSRPIVLGNMPQGEDGHAYEKVAFMGQVPVHVMGKVAIGDYILPSGNNDGIGRAVSPSEMSTDDYTNVVGVAWSASKNNTYSLIKVAIGLNDGDVSKIVVENKNAINQMKSRMKSSSAVLANLVSRYREFAPISQQRAFVSKPTTPTYTVPLTGELKIPDATIYELPSEQIEKMLDMAEKSAKENGADLNINPFWSKMKTEPGFRANYIKEMQALYKKEIQVQIDRYKPKQ